MTGSSFTLWICVFVGCTAVPMSIDLLRVFLPRRLQSGRLVEAWQRPLLLAMVTCLCVWAYMAFFPIAAYSHVPGSLAYLVWLAIITLLWINTVFHYAACAIVDPGYQQDGAVALAMNSSTKEWPAHAAVSSDAAAYDAPRSTALPHDATCAPARPDGTSLCKICARRVHSTLLALERPWRPNPSSL